MNRNFRDDCYLFDCPCCGHDGDCRITKEEKIFLYDNFKCTCPARKNEELSFDFKKDPIYKEFKDFHDSLEIIRKMKKV